MNAVLNAIDSSLDNNVYMIVQVVESRLDVVELLFNTVNETRKGSIDTRNPPVFVAVNLMPVEPYQSKLGRHSVPTHSSQGGYCLVVSFQT